MAARWRAVLRARTRAQWLVFALVATVTLPLWALPVYGVAIAAPAGALATLGMGQIVGLRTGPTGLVAVLGAVAPWVLRALWRRRRR